MKYADLPPWQKAMVDDGMPIELMLSQEERHEAWAKNPPRAMPSFVPKREFAPEAAEFIEKQKAEKKLRADNAFKARIGKAKQRSEYVPGAVWDTLHCKWVHPSTMRVGPSIQSPINEETTAMPGNVVKTVQELTEEYNAICNSPTGKVLGLKRIVKFKDHATAARRLKETRDKVYAEGRKREPSKEKVEHKRLPFNHSHGDIVDQFAFRSGSEREKLLHVLLDNFEGMVSKSSLGKLAGNASGIEWMIGQKKLPYELRETKENGVKSYGLFRKVHT